MLEILRNLIFGAAIAAPIGPVSLVVIRRGISGGFIAGLSVGLGAFLADVLYLSLFSFGLAGFVSDSGFKPLLWGFGALVLILLGLLSLSDYRRGIEKSGNKRIKRNALAAGFVVTMSSPITLFWWLAISSAMIVPGAIIESYLKLLAIPVGAFLWMVFISYLVGKSKKFLSNTSQRRLSLLAGILLMGFGTYFGYNAIIGA